MIDLGWEVQVLPPLLLKTRLRFGHADTTTNVLPIPKENCWKIPCH